MTIEFIDHALNVVLTGLLYGSEAWIASAFGFYVATHESAAPARASVAIGAKDTFIKDTAIEKTAAENAISKAVVDKVVTVAAEDVKTAEDITMAKVKTVEATTASIVCKPVDWKKWKVGDLRKADIARACGVRTHPVGSRRSLPKADLIAQYEQQLKRFGKLPVTASAKQEVLKGERSLA